MPHTPPDQYGWAGGCLGSVIGAVVLAAERIIHEADRDIVSFFAVLFWALIGAVSGGIIGAFIGALLRRLRR